MYAILDKFPASWWSIGLINPLRTPFCGGGPTGACSETASASRLGLQLGRSLWNSCQSIAQLLGTSSQVFEFTLSALALILGATLLMVGFMRPEQVVHCSSNFVRRRYNCLLRPEPRTHRSIVGAKR